MRMPKRGEKGFTLIELLIVVAILGVLAAVIIPNISRFFGAGETEANRTEKANVQSAVDNMMVANSIATLPNPVDGDLTATPPRPPTATMSAFPDATSVAGSADKSVDPNGTAYTAADDDGYILYGHDETGGGASGPAVNYMRTATTNMFYSADADGTVHQWKDAAKTDGEQST